MIKGVYCRPKTPPNAGGCIVSRREAVFNDGFYTVRGQPSDQFLTRAAYLLIAKNTLVSTLVRVRRTPEVKPAGITAEGRAIRGPIARHYTASYLDVNRHNHMIIFSPGGNPYPAFVAGPEGESCPTNILDLYAQHVAVYVDFLYQELDFKNSCQRK